MWVDGQQSACKEFDQKLMNTERSHGTLPFNSDCFVFPAPVEKRKDWNIQVDRKVTQPILKYLLMIATQYNLIGLINTISLWLFKSPRRSRHVLTCSHQSVNCLSTVEVKGYLFHKRNECSLSNTTWHLVLSCQNEFRDTFPDSPVPNKSTISRLVNRFRHCRNSSPVCIKHEEKSECVYRWTRWTFPTLNITFFFVFRFQCNLFLTNRTCVMGCVTFRSPYTKL
jgi:hypothetical protein